MQDLHLSRRQQQTLSKLLQGESEKQIAFALRLSRNTVHHYVTVLYGKFGVCTRSELLARWLTCALDDPGVAALARDLLAGQDVLVPRNPTVPMCLIKGTRA